MSAISKIQPAPRPAHVPPELVGDFNLMDDPSMLPSRLGDPHTAIARLLDGPPVFYSLNMTRNGEGAWIIVRAEDQRKVLQDGASFSANRNIFASALGETWPVIPLEIDPPEHGKYRSLLNPLLSPRRVMNLEPAVRARAVDLIEAIRAKGNSCEAMNEFAFPFAVAIFLQFLGIPIDRLHEFVDWANNLLHSTPEQRTWAARQVVGFLDELQAERRKRPTDDFMSFVTQAEIEGRKLSEHEVKAMSVLLFIGGLDTVAAALGFDLLYLAQHKDRQDLLRREPKRITLAAEEMLRAFPTVTPVRRATRDVELRGVTIKAGDLVACPSMTANRDPAEFPNPEVVDFEREDNRHVAFAYGPHRCLGSHLARREVVIGLEEFLARVPEFRLKQDDLPIVFGGFVFGVDNLVLEWD